MSRRAKDGRFIPRTGEAVLPPREKQPRDENGHFIPREKVQSSKPYSRAIRELLEAREGSVPPGWDSKDLTEAQALAMVHIAQAKSGNVQVGMMIIDRGEGKVPQAAEDREAQAAAGSGLRILAELLGIVPQARGVSSGDNAPPIIDAEIVPQLPPGEPTVPQPPAGEESDHNG